MEAIRSSETSVNEIPTRRHIPEDGILHRFLSETLRIFKLLELFVVEHELLHFHIFRSLIVGNASTNQLVKKSLPGFGENVHGPGTVSF
jgi:hypothetical protein